MSFTAAPRRRLVLLLVAVVAAALGGFVTQTATAGPPSSTGNTATGIVIKRVYSPDVPVPSGLPTGAAPAAVVVVGFTFSVEVGFTDARGKSTSLDAPTQLSMTAVGNEANVPLTTQLVAVPAGQRTATLTGTFTQAANQVRLTVDASGFPDLSTTAELGQSFDVLSEFSSTPTALQTALQTGIGGIDGCTSATALAPLCGTLLLPNGAASTEVFMSLGACDSTVYTKCGNRLAGSIVQVLADLTAPNPNPKLAEIDLYTKTSPATLILKCDKSLCGTGAIKGIPVNYTFLGNEALDARPPAPACPRKGTLGNNQELCVDYVQSKRDGASDTILYLLFTKDLRGGIS